MKKSHLLFFLLTAVVLNFQTACAAAASCCCVAKQAPGLSPGRTDKSLYQVKSTWTTDQGSRIQLGDLGGKPQVLLMFFSRCTSACPMLLSDLKRISAALSPAQRARIGFTLVSFDTEHDTPAALAEYRRTWALPVENWNLLCGHPDDVMELADLLGVKYKKIDGGQFAHSNIITVLNSRGEIVHQQLGLEEDITATVRKLGELSQP